MCGGLAAAREKRALPEAGSLCTFACACACARARPYKPPRAVHVFMPDRMWCASLRCVCGLWVLPPAIPSFTTGGVGFWGTPTWTDPSADRSGRPSFRPSGHPLARPLPNTTTEVVRLADALRAKWGGLKRTTATSSTDPKDPTAKKSLKRKAADDGGPAGNGTGGGGGGGATSGRVPVPPPALRPLSSRPLPPPEPPRLPSLTSLSSLISAHGDGLFVPSGMLSSPGAAAPVVAPLVSGPGDLPDAPTTVILGVGDVDKYGTTPGGVLVNPVKRLAGGRARAPGPRRGHVGFRDDALHAVRLFVRGDAPNKVWGGAGGAGGGWGWSGGNRAAHVWGRVG